MFMTIRRILRPKLLRSGTQAPNLSLTAQDGRWIRSEDYEDRSICLLFFKECSAETAIWLKEFEAINDLDDEHVFAITTSKPEALRTFAEENDIKLLMLYDPLGIESRRFGASGRRFQCRDSVVYIGPNGVIEAALSGRARLDLINEARASFLRSENDPEMSTGSDADLEARDTHGGLPTNAVQMISPDAAVSLLKEHQDFSIVDVRTFSEYEPDHIPGSLHIPVDELHQRHTELMGKPGLLFICQAGGRAFSAAEFMASIGQNDLYVVEGGMSSWTGPRKTDGVIQQ